MKLFLILLLLFGCLLSFGFTLWARGIEKPYWKFRWNLHWPLSGLLVSVIVVYILYRI